MKSGITDRQAEVIQCIIEEYVKMGIPVSSQVLSSKYKLPYSSATIRKEMSILEQMDYLVSPHTSAGRQPTEEAFRFYIDQVLNLYQITLEEKKRLDRYYENVHMQIDQLLHMTAQILAKTSLCSGFVTAPLPQNSIIHSIQLVSIRDDYALLIMVSTAGTIFQKKVRLFRSATQEDLHSISSFFNEHLSGLDIESLQRNGLSFLSESCRTLEELGELAVSILQNLVYEPPEQKVYLEGLNDLYKMLSIEKHQIDKIEDVVQQIKDKVFLKYFSFSSNDPNEIFSKVGVDLGGDSSLPLSILGKQYFVDGRRMGLLGVVGSVRMPYDRLIPTLFYTSHLLSGALRVQDQTYFEDSLGARKMLGVPSNSEEWSITLF